MEFGLLKKAAVYSACLCVALTSCRSAKTGQDMALSADPLGSLRASIASIADSCPAEIGVAVIADNGDTLTLNNRNVYPMMSVFKLHQAIAVCEDLDRRGIPLDSRIRINRADLDPDTWSPMLKEHDEPQFELTVKDLLRYTLMQSDNNASNLMFSEIAGVGQTDSLIATIIPRDAFRIVYAEREMARDHGKAYANRTTPLGAAQLIYSLYTDSLVSVDKQEFLRNTLRECKTGNDRIVAPLLGKKGVVIGHKTGSGYTTPEGVLVAHNDVAYICLPDGRKYALAVFVKDCKGDEKRAAEAIARISEAVYDALGI